MGRRFRYRRYVGRRKSMRGRSRIIILCVLVFTALVVYLSVMLGLRLREKAEKVRAESEFLSTVETTPSTSSQPPAGLQIWKEKISAHFVSSANIKSGKIPENNSTLSTVLKSENGAERQLALGRNRYERADSCKQSCFGNIPPGKYRGNG